MSTDRMIGILMTRDEDDMVGEFLANITRVCDRIFILDGSGDEAFARANAVYEKYDEVKWVKRDKDISGEQLTDGARHYLLEEVRRQYGSDNWIAVLHGDELFSMDPRPLIAEVDHVKTPVIRTRLVHFFLHTDDELTYADRMQLPVQERITHYMWPGSLEDRFFYDDGKCKYDPAEHSRTVPYPVPESVVQLDDIVIKHYNYRNPEQMIARAEQRTSNGWQKNHYQHIVQKHMIFIDSLHVPGFDPCGWDNVAKKDSPELMSQPRCTDEEPLACLG
jgi:hypothetical protein